MFRGFARWYLIMFRNLIYNVAGAGMFAELVDAHNLLHGQNRVTALRGEQVKL